MHMAEQRSTSGERRLQALVSESPVREAETVMAPEFLGAARLTRYSFSRTMLRRAAADGWTVDRTRFEVDADGAGETIYRVTAGDEVLSFVAFTSMLDESLHTDRVVAADWEITGALVVGDAAANPELMERLRSEVPKQENGRLTSDVLTLTRGNRSVRFFDYVVDSLASGRQPDPDLVADAGYIMRSTAFYGNGKFGMRSFEGLDEGGSVSAPYRAQMLGAWCFRELTYDIVEHCARAKGGGSAVGFNNEWSHYFGLGNATGLGLVPYAFKHPRVIDSWVAIREVALASARAADATPERIETVRSWTQRAITHFSSGNGQNSDPFLSPVEVAAVARNLLSHFDELLAEDPPSSDIFDRWYSWAETQGAETAELCVSILLELGSTLDPDLDEELDSLLVVDETVNIDPVMTAGNALELIASRFGWIDDLDAERFAGNEFWWVMSDSNEEPRRVRRENVDPGFNDVALDVVRRMLALRADLDAVDAETTMGQILASHPEHTLAAKRLIESDRPFGEPRDNPCSQVYLPLQLQRFQLAMYGMDNFKPKSTDWLRVTLFQGAPRHADLNREGAALTDDWVLPSRPSSPVQHESSIL